MNSADTNSGCVRELQVEVPADAVAQETDALIHKYQKLARVPGFRRGKVPAGVIRQRYGEELKSELAEKLIPQYLHREFEKQGLAPVSQPSISDLQFGPGEPLRFKAVFEILPEIDVSGYQELRVPAPQLEVSDEELTASLNKLREEHATYTAIEERPLQDGDYTQISFVGAPRETGAAGNPAQPVKVDEVLVEIGGANTIPEFSENLRGAAAGEVRQFSVTYAQDFADRRLAGRTFDYEVTIRGIKEKQLPNLDDDLAREGEFEDFSALQQHYRKILRAAKERGAALQGKEQIVNQLVERIHFPVPQVLVDDAINTLIERGVRSMLAQGVLRPQDLKNLDVERMRDSQRDTAIRNVKSSLILERIAELEQVVVTDAETDAAIAAVARDSKRTEEELRAQLTRDGGLDKIRDRLRNEKTLDQLYRRALAHG